MARWQEIVDSEPQYGERVQALFDSSRHKTMATVRKDGGPRISGVEANFADGELWIGSMKGSRKSADLLRDDRVALHGPPQEPSEDNTVWAGEAKLSGRAIRETDQERLQAMGGDDADLFRLDIEAVVLTGLGGDPPDHLVIELWQPDSGLRVLRRE